MSDELGIPGLEGAVEIGAGGFGVVYRARQPAFGRDVAVKVLAAPFGDDLASRRFERECQALGSLAGHPHIVAVHDGGVTEGGRPYLTMDLVPAGSLADLLAREGRFEWPDAVAVGVKLAGALAAAHAAGVLHRDVKPQNVLVSAYGEPLLADFGIARIAGTATDTRSGMVTGSILHAPPEILDGARPDETADVYSLASTVLTLLIGRAPFCRTTDETTQPVVARILHQPPPDLRPHGVPDDLCTVIEAAMAKDPRERVATAAELGRALQHVQGAHGLPVTPMALPDGDAPLPRAGADRRPVGRSRVGARRPGWSRAMVAIVVSAVVAAGLAAAVAATALAGSSSPPAGEPVVATAQAGGPATTAPPTTATAVTSTAPPTTSAPTTAPPVTTVPTTAPPPTATTAPVATGPPVTSPPATSPPPVFTAPGNPGVALSYWEHDCPVRFVRVDEGGYLSQSFRADSTKITRAELWFDGRRDPGRMEVSIWDGDRLLGVAGAPRVDGPMLVGEFAVPVGVTSGGDYTVRVTNLNGDGMRRSFAVCERDDQAGYGATLSGASLGGLDVRGAVVGPNDVVR